MKPLVTWLALVALVAAPAVIDAADFEGKVRMKMTVGDHESHAIDYAVKAGVVRTEFSSGQRGGATMIMNLPQHQMTILMPQQHMYVVRSLSAPGAAEPGAGKPGDPDASFERTGETEKILGYDCTKYVARSHDAVTDLWLTEQLGTFAPMTPSNAGAMGGGGPAGSTGWERLLAGRNFFPMRVVSHDAAGKETVRMEVESVEPQSLPDDLFTPPADYRKIDMGGMMRGLGAPSR